MVTLKTGGKMNKRQFQRVTAPHLTADISDGHGFFSGHVKDVSRFGLKLDGVHHRLREETKQLSIIVSGQGKNFKIRALPRWVHKQSYSKNLGVEILNVPIGWTEFVMNFEPETKMSEGQISI